MTEGIFFLHVKGARVMMSDSVTCSHPLTHHLSCNCRRQTAEEREAERQAANRLLMSLQSDPPKASNGHMYPNLHASGLGDAGASQVKPEDAALVAAASMSGLNLPYSTIGSLHSLPPSHPWSSAHQAHQAHQAFVASHLSGLMGRAPPGSTGMHHDSLNPYSSMPPHLTSSLC